MSPDDLLDWLDAEDLIGYLSDEDLRCVNYEQENDSDEDQWIN